MASLDCLLPYLLQHTSYEDNKAQCRAHSVEKSEV